MIPKSITDAHIRSAIKEIDIKGVPKRRVSYEYDLLINGKTYPPKLVISFACKFATGKELSYKSFNAVTAKDYFICRKYQILEKHGRRVNAPPVIKGEDEESAFPEGKERFKMHRYLERDPNIAKKAKQQRMQIKGELRCDVCNFSFASTYGILGEGYIEAHHTTPVSKLSGKTKTKISELALVCSNCHRIVHRANLSIEELRNIVEENRIN